MREMKDSGIEWIGEIPREWELNRIQFCLVGINDKNVPVRTKQVLSLVKGQGVMLYEEKGDVGNKSKDNVAEYKLAYPNSLVVNSMNVLIGSVGISKYFGCVSPVYYVFKETKFADLRFINYIFSTREFQKELRKYANGILEIRLRVSADNIFKRKIPLPLKREQTIISNFLDQKCSEIDSLVADIQSQIETLEQYKKSIITEAVTKGLNLDVEMKDSGIAGAGKIPSHWNTTRLCYECYIRARLGWRGLKADEYVDEGYAFISAFNIQNGKLVWTPLNYITKERFDESPEIKIYKGDVLIVKDGAGVGKCARVDDLPMGGTAPNSSIAVLTPNKRQDYRYVCYYLQSAIFNNAVLLLYNGMGVPHLTQEIMSKIKIFVPPLKEQIAISDFLDKKCTEIDDTLSMKQEQLSVLQEYKKSLIYEYVTGKKEVPNQ